MGTALSSFVLLSLSAFVIRVASVALRLTGLDVIGLRLTSGEPQRANNDSDVTPQSMRTLSTRPLFSQSSAPRS